MLPLPALVPGIFTSSSSRLGAVPFLTTQGKRAARMGRPRAGTASNCVIIVRLYLGGVNGTDGLGPNLGSRNVADEAETPPQDVLGKGLSHPAARRPGLTQTPTSSAPRKTLDIRSGC
jgi:hypothetical protein